MATSGPMSTKAEACGVHMSVAVAGPRAPRHTYVCTAESSAEDSSCGALCGACAAAWRFSRRLAYAQDAGLLDKTATDKMSKGFRRQSAMQDKFQKDSSVVINPRRSPSRTSSQTKCHELLPDGLQRAVGTTSGGGFGQIWSHRHAGRDTNLDYLHRFRNRPHMSREQPDVGRNRIQLGRSYTPDSVDEGAPTFPNIPKFGRNQPQFG